MHKGLDTLQKRLYQLVIARLQGADVLNDKYRERIFGLVNKGIGGFILFGGKRDEVRAFIDEISSVAEIPLFIASDIERGVGQQIGDMTHFPCNMAVASAVHIEREEDVVMLEDMITAIAREAKEAGINMPLIPVIDVNKNPDNPIICTRAFSDDPYKVAWFGSKFINILEKYGLVSCAKHFPGHGDTSVDSHMSLPLISKSLKDIYETDLIPFKKAIKDNVSAIMIGHLSVPAIDSVPTSVSYKTINDLLKKGLGFEGLILTDALNMKALKDIDNIPAKCLLAGANVLLHPDDIGETVLKIQKAIESGELDEKIIHSSIACILKTKQKLGDLAEPSANLIDNDILSKKIIGKSITLIKNSRGVLPIKKFGDCSLILVGDIAFFDTAHLRSSFKDVSNITDIKEKMDGITIVAIFTTVSAWNGSSGLNQLEINRIRELVANADKSVVVSFGSPYVLRHFPDADVLIAAYDKSGYYQHAVAELLINGGEFKGRLPIRLYEI
jgi:beta-glucosidase-like glycosyl hydrolase